MGITDDKEIEEALHEAKLESMNKEEKKYTLEIFLSTDGKHTVHVKVKDPNSRHEAVKKVMEMYDYILTRYGTKQAQAVREYGNGEKINQETCQHKETKFVQAKTEKNAGRWFKSCKLCNKFLGWTS